MEHKYIYYSKSNTCHLLFECLSCALKVFQGVELSSFSFDRCDLSCSGHLLRVSV